MLVHNSSEPLYQQIFIILRDRIMQGQWQAGDLLPSEPELMEQYQVSRTTIRLALDRLVNTGLIYRQRGRGTFVAPTKIEQNLNQGIRFEESIVRDGAQYSLQTETKVLAAKLVPASYQTTKDLQVQLNEPLAVIERLRLVNQEPIAVQVSILVYRYCQGILNSDFAKHSLYDVLEKEYDIRLVRVQQRVQAVAASASLANQLAIAIELPLLYVDRISYDQEDRPIELLRSHYRSDRYSLQSEFHHNV